MTNKINDNISYMSFSLVQSKVTAIEGEELEKIQAEEEALKKAVEGLKEDEQFTGKKRGRKPKAAEAVSEETEDILASLDEETVTE